MVELRPERRGDDAGAVEPLNLLEGVDGVEQLPVEGGARRRNDVAQRRELSPELRDDRPDGADRQLRIRDRRRGGRVRGEPAGGSLRIRGDDDAARPPRVERDVQRVAGDGLDDGSGAAHGDRERARRGGMDARDGAELPVERRMSREVDCHRRSYGELERLRCSPARVRDDGAGSPRAGADPETAARAGRPVPECAAACGQRDRGGCRGCERAGEDDHPSVGCGRVGGERHGLRANLDPGLRGLAVGGGRGDGRRPQAGRVDVLDARTVGRRSVAEIPVIRRAVARCGERHGERRLAGGRRRRGRHPGRSGERLRREGQGEEQEHRRSPHGRQHAY